MMMIMMNKMAPFWPYKKGPESRKDPVYRRHPWDDWAEIRVTRQMG